MPSRIIAILACLSLALPLHATAQGQMHPRWEIPGFEFSQDGVWRARARRIRETRAALLSQRAFARLNAGAAAPGAAGAAVAASGTVVTGVLQVPAILLRFADTNVPALHDTSEYRVVLFGTTPPAGRPYTIRTFYEELSHGLFSMQGQVLGWVALSKPEVSYTGGTNCSGNPFGSTNCNGIFSSPSMSPIDSLQAGLREGLTLLDASGVDWGQFDNDGPDGVPNSGDDDGYVDMAIFIHPNVDGACGANNNVWSHRYVLVDHNGFEADYTTATPAHNGGFIKVRDYTIQSGVGGAQACSGTQIMPIGTAAHESGHGLGLPDLYDTQYATQGAGQWGLMGSGNYTAPLSPSRMEAWSLAELGWVTAAPLTLAGTYGLGAAPTAESTFVVRIQGSNPRGEYFLLENREAVLADTALIRIHCAKSGNPPNCGGGLLIWHIDSLKVASNGFHAGNTVNAGPIHGVALAQADGRRNLDYPDASSLTTRGDAGDPYPGVTGNTAFSFATNPAAIKNWDGSFVGFAIDSIRRTGTNGAVFFRMRFGSLTQVQASDTVAQVEVDGASYHRFADLLDSTSHTVSVADTQYRADALVRWVYQSWSDGGARTHAVTPSTAGSTFEATLVRAFRVVVGTSGPGTVSANPTGALTGAYLSDASTLQLAAHPANSMIFVGWSGDTTTADSLLAMAMTRPWALTATFEGQLAASKVLQQLVAASGLTTAEIRYVDNLGNKNDPAHVDVGDFLAWVRAARPTPPGTASAVVTVRKVEP
ncbi:MAG TPA: M6 family metalloprotease domain-containing protein [Gemmatimonadales bacterium]|nr:M6 family metalloprotease domain-containing protein [Gemmatimonadales bacterium]